MSVRALPTSLAVVLLTVCGCAREPLTAHYDLQREAPLAEWVFPPGVSVTLSPTLDVHFNEAARADRALEGLSSPSRLEARAFTKGPIPAGQSVSIALFLEPPGWGPREIWSAEVSAGSAPAEVVLPLAAKPGHARITFHVEGRSGAPVATGWRTPRIFGRGGVERLRARAQPAEERARAGPLRGSLAGLNVLVVELDAGAARHFSAYGYTRATTLNVDRLAREGVLFERAYTPAPFTIAAVSSMWTSLYPEQHHAGTRHRAPLPRERRTLAELLSARGVSTAGFAANPSAAAPFGLARGFQEFH